MLPFFIRNHMSKHFLFPFIGKRLTQKNQQVLVIELNNSNIEPMFVYMDKKGAFNVEPARNIEFFKAYNLQAETFIDTKPNQ